MQYAWWILKNQSMYNHNKAQQRKNRVHISWDILYSSSCRLSPHCYSLGVQCFSARYKGGLIIGYKLLPWNHSFLSWKSKIYLSNRTVFQYPIRHLIVRSRKVSKPRNWYVEYGDHSAHCYRCACPNSKRYHSLLTRILQRGSGIQSLQRRMR